MKIRSITSFYDPSAPQANIHLSQLAEFTREAASRLAAAGFEVQTARLATTPFCNWIPAKDWLARAREYEQAAAAAGFQYLSIGPIYPGCLQAYEAAPQILAATQNVFLTGMLTNLDGSISLPAVRACAGVIAATSKITPDGFTNLRFAGMANVQPYAPFLPAAYQPEGAPPACAVAMECTDHILKIFHGVPLFAEGRAELLRSLEEVAERMQAVLDPLLKRFDIQFKGFDFSTAPFPQDWCSLAGALEAFGVEKLGLNGSLAAAAFLADTLDRGRWLRTGFNGLFLPVMEDSVLALRASEGVVTVRDLLLYSSVCGTGLDTVPLPGDSTPEQISALLLDVAALSSRLNKPLTARLMPIPGKKAGDPIEFDFEFFAKGKVMALPAQPLHGLFAGTEEVDILPRNR